MSLSKKANQHGRVNYRQKPNRFMVKAAAKGIVFDQHSRRTMQIRIDKLVDVVQGRSRDFGGSEQIIKMDP
jgi:hypothetical protein